MYYEKVESPLGEILIATDGKYLTGTHFSTDRHFKQIPSEWEEDPRQPVLIKTKQQLNKYFDGSQQQFEIPLAFVGTKLQHEVWQKLQQVPFGKTISYKQLAQQTKNPKAIRAVASAVGKNPIAIIIPCHRIIAHDGSLGGYGSGLDHKKFLLRLEGTSKFG
jgi:methylated-DNA-[protein]-cysteine S-methyltransferase